MQRVDVNCKIKTYPECDEKRRDIEIKSHWNFSDRVHLIINKEDHIVIGRDLIAAIQKCMNNG